MWSNQYILLGSSGVYSGTRFNQHKNDKGHQTRLSKFYKSNKNSITQLKRSILREIKEYVLINVMIVKYAISNG